VIEGGRLCGRIAQVGHMSGGGICDSFNHRVVGGIVSACRCVLPLFMLVQYHVGGLIQYRGELNGG
jgi:hypothetical protein